MAKRLVVYTSSLIVLVSIIGCLRPKPATATARVPSPSMSEPAPPVTDNLKPDEGAQPVTQPNAAANAPAKPDVNEPPTDDPNHVAPAESPPRQIEPNNLEPGPIEPNVSTPVVPEPNQAEPNDLKPAKVEPDKVDANNIEPVKVEPNDVDANNIEPIKMAPAILETEPNDPNTTSAVSFHNRCAGVLKSFVDENGMVDYKTLSRKRLELKSLFGDFDELDPNEYNKWSNEDKMALWINAYNIQMLDIITRNYPIKPSSRVLLVFPGWGPNSTRHIDGIWNKYKFMVMDEVFTLSEIEERFFRKEFQEPRVFLALTRASLSSPPLRNEPYYGYKLYKQLDDQVRKFLANPSAFSMDKEKGKVYLSALFQKTFYGGQFVGKYGTDKKFKQKETETAAVLNFISNYVSEEVKSYLELGNYTVQFIGYNWTINDGSQ